MPYRVTSGAIILQSPASALFKIQIANTQSLLSVDEARIRATVESVLTGEGITAATVSVAVVDDAEIRRVNREFLEHDFATDTISFVLSERGEPLEGELVIGAQTAIASAARYGWSPHDELLLYLIHATLHLAGHDDQTPNDLAKMRERERKHLADFGLAARYD